MMRIKQYDITLRRIEKQDIEIIRKSRNSEAIKQNMIYREHITKSMQLKWFKSIEKSITNTYYVIIKDRKKIGLININNDKKKKFIESGLFLFKKEYYKTPVPVIASLMLIYTELYVWNGKESFIKVLKTNHNVLNYNKSIGYFISSEKDNYYIMKITRSSFENKTKKLRTAIKNLYGKSYLEYVVDPIDFQSGYINFLRSLIPNISKEFIVSFEETSDSLKLVMDIDID